MRRPVDVKTVFLFLIRVLFRLSRAASVAILPSALFGEGGWPGFSIRISGAPSYAFCRAGLFRQSQQEPQLEPKNPALEKHQGRGTPNAKPQLRVNVLK